LWLRGSVSLILNPFLRVFDISAFLKVIHAPKNPENPLKSGASKINFPHIILDILAIGTTHGPYKHPSIKDWSAK